METENLAKWNGERREEKKIFPRMSFPTKRSTCLTETTEKEQQFF